MRPGLVVPRPRRPKWNDQTAMAVRGSHILNAFRKAAEEPGTRPLMWDQVWDCVRSNSSFYLPLKARMK